MKSEKRMPTPNVPAKEELPADEPMGALEPVAYFDGAMPTGVTISQKQGRIFVNFPRWGDDVPFTVAEIRDGKAIAFPDEAINQTDQNDQAAALVSVQSRSEERREGKSVDVGGRCSIT